MTRRSSRTSALLARHLTAYPAGAITLALLVIVLSTVGTAAPRAVATMDTAALRQQVDAIAPAQRDLSSTAVGIPQPGGSTAPRLATARLSAGDDVVWGKFDDEVSGLRAGFPQLLRSATGAPDYVLSLDPTGIDYSGTGHHTAISLAYDPRSDRHVRYVDGTAPGPYTGGELDIALSVASAEALEWSVGQTRTVPTGVDASLTLRLTGRFAQREGTAGYFSHVPLLLTASVEQQGLAPPIYTGTALVDPGALGLLGSLPAAARVQTWFPLDVSNLSADEGEQLLAQLRAEERVPPSVGIQRPGFYPSPLTFRAGAADTLEQALAARAASDAVILMMAAGPFGVVVAVLALGCRVISRRRRDALRLLAARGASRAGRMGLLGLEGVVIALPAALLGTAIGLLSTPGPIGLGVLLAPLLFTAITAGLLAASVRSAESDTRADLSTGGGGRWRVAVEAAVLLLAGVGTVALLQRDRDGSLDPLLVAVPLLLAGAACVVALRLYPLPLAALARRGRGRVGLGAFLGPSRALRDRAIGLAPVFALLVGTAVAVSSGVLLTSVQHGITAAAQTAVGADVRISGNGFTEDQVKRVSALPGVEATTTASGNLDAIVDTDGRRSNITVVVVDPDELDRVQNGSAGALPLTALSGRSGSTVPVSASEPLAREISESAKPSIDGQRVRVVGTVPAPNALSPRAGVVIVARENSGWIADAGAEPHTVLIRLEAGARFEDIRARLVRIAGTDAMVEAAQAVADERAALPATAGLQTALTTAIVLSGLLGAVTLAMTLVLGAPARARTMTLLRMLGARRGEERALVAWELGPPVAAAVVVGVALGIALPIIVLAGVDLRAFTGGLIRPTVSVDVLATALLVLGFLAVTALFTAGGLVLSRSARAASILRTVEEG